MTVGFLPPAKPTMLTPAEAQMLTQLEALLAEHGGADPPDECVDRGDAFSFAARTLLAITPVTAAGKGVDFGSIRVARTTLLDLSPAERLLIADLVELSDEQKARLRDSDGDQRYSIDDMTSMILAFAAHRKSGGGTPEQLMAAAKVFKCFIEALPKTANEKERPDPEKLTGKTLPSLPPASRLDLPHEPASKQKVGRNDPCPCGSGKKFKNCCIKKHVGL